MKLPAIHLRMGYSILAKSSKVIVQFQSLPALNGDEGRQQNRRVESIVMGFD